MTWFPGRGAGRFSGSAPPLSTGAALRGAASPAAGALIASAAPPPRDDLHSGEDPVEKMTSWRKILEHLKSRVDERDFETWFRGFPAEVGDDRGRRRPRPAPRSTSTTSREAFGAQIADAAQRAGFGNREIRFVADGDYASARRAAPRSRPSRAAGRRPESRLHVRALRHGRVEPARARRRAPRRRPDLAPVQPALHLRRDRPRQDPPDAGDRPPPPLAPPGGDASSTSPPRAS